MKTQVHNKRKGLILNIINLTIKLILLPGNLIFKKPDIKNLTIKKILLIRLDHIGDVVMTSPAFHIVREKFPEAEIFLLSDMVAKQLYEKDPILNHVIPFNWPWVHQKKNNRFTIKIIKEIYHLVVYLRKLEIDTIIDFRGDLRFIILFGVFIGAKLRISNSRCGNSSLLQFISDYNVSKHEVERSVDVIRCFGNFSTPIMPAIFLENNEINLLKEKLERTIDRNLKNKIVTIAPYSSKEIKSWPMDSFRKVIKYLISNEFIVFVVGALEDKSNAELLIHNISGSVYSLAGETSIRELSALVSISHLVIGVDTGVLHIASCFEVQIIAIFGSTRSFEFRPYSELATVVETNTCKCNQFLHNKCDYPVRGYAGCISDVTPEMIIDSIINTLHKPESV